MLWSLLSLVLFQTYDPDIQHTSYELIKVYARSNSWRHKCLQCQLIGSAIRQMMKHVISAAAAYPVTGGLLRQRAIFGPAEPLQHSL